MSDRDLALIRRTALGLILIATAIPFGFRRPRISRRQTRFFPVDFVLNVVLYAPFGFGNAQRSFAGALGRGAALSVLIESLQSTYRGRSATLLDVAANSAGAALGWLLFHVTRESEASE